MVGEKQEGGVLCPPGKIGLKLDTEADPDEGTVVIPIMEANKSTKQVLREHIMMKKKGNEENTPSRLNEAKVQDCRGDKTELKDGMHLGS